MKLYLNGLAACTLLVIASGAAKLPGHVVAGSVLAVLSVGLFRCGWTGRAALAVAALEFVPAHPMFHAFLAPVLFAIIVLLRTESYPAAARSKTVLWLAAATPFTVLAQIAMGAAYRHKVSSVMPHMAGAAIAVSVTLILSVLLIQKSPELRSPSIILLAVVLSQASLGIASFILRLLDLDSTIWFTILSTAHVTVAALLLAASTSLWRFVVGDPTAHR
jgi:heme A synthase